MLEEIRQKFDVWNPQQDKDMYVMYVLLPPALPQPSKDGSQYSQWPGTPVRALQTNGALWITVLSLRGLQS